MEKNPRYVEIDYAKYAPDIPEDQLEAYYGLPKHVQFCNECVMSNQKPNSCYEFEHTIKSIKKTMVIQDDGTCDACHACHNKANGHIDWALREKELRELCDEYRKNDGSYDWLVPGSGVGNRRSALDQGTLGVPVIAVGIPTVVDADPRAGLFLTPRDIDQRIRELGRLLGYGITLALQPSLTAADVTALLG